MTTDPFEQLMTDARNVHLTNEERAAMRRALMGTMYAHPVRPRLSAFFARHAFAYAFTAFALLVGGTTALAHRSLPGSPLYPLKTAVSERIAVAVVSDEDARIQKELDLIGRALDEEDIVAESEFDIKLDEEIEELPPIRFDDDLDSDLRDFEKLMKEVKAEAAAELSL